MSGHADLRMTLRYAHLAPSHLRESVAVLEQAPAPLRQPAVNGPLEASIADSATVDSMERRIAPIGIPQAA